jgi:hypothetical protein
VHGFLGEQEQDGRADVAPRGAAAAVAAAAASALRREARSIGGGIAGMAGMAVAALGPALVPDGEGEI